MLARRSLIGLTLAALGALPAAGLVRAEAPSLSPDMKRIFDRGKLLVAVAGFETPPFVVTGADGQPVGSDIDLASGMAQALGVGIAFDRRARNFNELIDIVAGHEADLTVSKVSETLDRAARVRFSRPYLVLRHALLLNRLRFAQIAKGRDPIEVVRDFDATVGVVAGTAYVEYARRLLPHAKLRLYPRWEPDLVEAVLTGQVVAAYRDELEVKRALASRPDGPLQLRPAILTDTRDPIGAAVPWDSGQLLAWIDFYLETQVKPVSVDELLARDAQLSKDAKQTKGETE